MVAITYRRAHNYVSPRQRALTASETAIRRTAIALSAGEAAAVKVAAAARRAIGRGIDLVYAKADEFLHG